MTLEQSIAAAVAGKTQQAVEGFISLIGTPQESLARFNLGLIYKGDDKLLEALEEFERAAVLEPTMGEIVNEIGLIHDQQGRMSLAEPCYKKAVELTPTLASAWNNYGVCAFLKGDFAGARVRFERAVQEDPEMASAWFNLRDTCEELGDEKAAQAADKEYLNLSKI